MESIFPPPAPPPIHHLLLQKADVVTSHSDNNHHEEAPTQSGEAPQMILQPVSTMTALMGSALSSSPASSMPPPSFSSRPSIFSTQTSPSFSSGLAVPPAAAAAAAATSITTDILGGLGQQQQQQHHHHLLLNGSSSNSYTSLAASTSAPSYGGSAFPDIEIEEVHEGGFTIEATKCLIRVLLPYLERDDKKDWELISQLMAREGYLFSAIKIRQRWYNIFKDYKDIVNRNARAAAILQARATAAAAEGAGTGIVHEDETEAVLRRMEEEEILNSTKRKRQWRYFHLLDPLLRDRVTIQPPATADGAGSEASSGDIANQNQGPKRRKRGRPFSSPSSSLSSTTGGAKPSAASKMEYHHRHQPTSAQCVMEGIESLQADIRKLTHHMIEREQAEKERHEQLMLLFQRVFSAIPPQHHDFDDDA